MRRDHLNLKVWPPLDGRKRAVQVWNHGGISVGNSIEQDGYYGANLTRVGESCS